MANKPPAVSITGIRASIPSGYMLGRVSPGQGDVELISAAKAQSVGLIPSTLPGPPTGAAGGDLSGSYPNPVVSQLQGRPVAATAPSNLAALLYHTAGATWLPVVLGAVAYTSAYSDLSGVPTIHNVPAGGTTGQVLTKNSNTDYDIVWATPSGGSGGGAASAQDDGTNLYLAISDGDGQLVLDGSGDPIFQIEVLPLAAIPTLDTAHIPNAAGYVTGPRSAEVVGKVKGIIDGSSAAAGDVGEKLKAVLLNASSVTPANNVQINVISLSLTPGDWDVYGILYMFPFGATMNSASAGLSLVSATLPSAAADPTGTAELSVPFTVSASSGFPLGPLQVNVSVNTTVYLVGQGGFSGGTLFMWGAIIARRMR